MGKLNLENLSLGTNVDAEEVSKKANDLKNQKVDFEVPPLETYINKFTQLYNIDNFRDEMFDYLKLSGFYAFKLSLKKAFNKKAYNQEVTEIITRYATEVREATIAEQKLGEAIPEFEKLKEENSKKFSNYSDYKGKQVETSSILSGTKEDFSKKKEELIYTLNNSMNKIEEDKTKKLSGVKKSTDIESIVKGHIEDALKKTSMIKANERGKLQFDEKNIMYKIEDIMLRDVIEGEMHSSVSGFVSNHIQQQNQVFSHWGNIDGMSDLHNVDWVASLIESRVYGYENVSFEHLVAAKYMASFMAQKGSLDTALTVDNSGSMKGNPWEIAKKATLALHSLMRKINPKNNTYLSVFNNILEEASTADLLRNIGATGGTDTHKALNWLYDTLADSGVSVAYLITDGAPNNVELAEKSARRFYDSSIFLRLILVKTEYTKEGVLQSIGKAAGPNTKMMEIDYSTLGKNLLSDVSSAFTDMQNINYF